MSSTHGRSSVEQPAPEAVAKSSIPTPRPTSEPVAAGGVCVLLGYNWARWAGIALAVIGGVGTFLFLPIYPFWSILVIAIDVFIVWALASARRRQEI